MKAQYQISVTLVIILAISCFLFFRWYNTSLEGYTPSVMVESASDACKKISSRAEEIEAEYGGIAKVTAAAWGPFSPLNYRSGDNTSDDLMRNIVNTNLSSDDIVKIDNECKNISASMQINEIDLASCPYCQNNGCSIANVKQENISQSKQLCTLQAATEALRSKTNSIDAQALAQTLQKAQDVLSGNNTSKKQNCNVVNTDMSAHSYLEQISKCSNDSSVKQENRLVGCGPVLNVIQRNANNNFQECLSAATTTLQDTASNAQTFKTETKSDQSSTGLDIAKLMAFLSAPYMISIIVVFSILSISLLSAVPMLFQSSNTGSTPAGGAQSLQTLADIKHLTQLLKK